MKSKEQILNEFGCPEIPFNETVTMYYPAILSAMEEYAHQSPPTQEGESVWVEVPVNERLPDKPDCYFVMWKLENGGAIIGEAMWDFEVKGKFDVSDDDDDDIQNPRGAQPTHWLERRTPQESKEGVEDWISVVAMPDESSHNYLVPNELVDKFRELEEKYLETEDEDIVDEFNEIFSKYCTGGDINNTQLYIKAPHPPKSKNTKV